MGHMNRISARLPQDISRALMAHKMISKQTETQIVHEALRAYLGTPGLTMNSLDRRLSRLEEMANL